MTDEQKRDLIENQFFDQVEPSIEQSFFQMVDVSELDIPVLNKPLSKPKSGEVKL